MSIKNFLIGCGVGSLSGVLSFIALIPFGLLGVFMVPGIIFGIVTFFYFSFFAKKDGGLIQPLAWIFMCGVSYFLAIMITLNIPRGGNCTAFGCDFLPVAFILGGLAGATLVVFSFYFLINRVPLVFLFLVILSGGILSLAWYIPVGGQENNMLWLFVVWQAGICGLLASSQPDVIFKRK